MQPPPDPDLTALAAAATDDLASLLQLRATLALQGAADSARAALAPFLLGGVLLAIGYLLALVGAVSALTPILGLAGAAFTTGLAHLLPGAVAVLGAVRRAPSPT
jgi:hypothetical protein